MKTWFHRTLILLALMAALTMSLAAQGDPLPVPSALRDEEPLVIGKLFPDDGATVTYSNLLTWMHHEPTDKYILKLVVAGTGHKIKYQVPMNRCTDGGSCKIIVGATLLFDHVDDGDTVSWRVIAKVDGAKLKSEVRTVIVDSVSAPETLMPANWAILLPVFNLTWDASDANATYKVVVKNVETGEVAMKHTIPYTECTAVCAVNPHIDGQLAPGTLFTWFVKVKGFNGDKAKSVFHMFGTPANAAATR